ncbi:MAG: cache domain-containing protein, partial [Pseudomonadota bacterium]
MRLLQNMSIRLKLPIMMISVVMATLFLADYLAHKHAASSLQGMAETKFSAVTDNRVNQTEAWFADLRGEALAQGENPFVTTAFRAFRKGWTRTQEALPGEEGRVALRGHFSGEPMATDGLDPVFASAHDRYDTFFRGVVQRSGFKDVFLVTLDGDVIYSVRKSFEFANNIADAPLGGTALADVFNELQENAGDAPAYADFAPYVGGQFDVASFMGRPLLDAAGTPIGAIIFRIEVDRIRDIFLDRSNLGETGQALLVNEQGILALGDEAFGREGETLISSPAVTRALAGLEGSVDIESDGRAYRDYFAPITMLGKDWAIVFRKSIEEIAAPEVNMTRDMLRDGTVLLIVSVIISLAVARSITWPLATLQKAMAAIRRGEPDRPIPYLDRRDEVGRMARALSDFRGAMQQNQELALENSFKGAAFEGASSPQTLIDLDMRIAYANHAFGELLAQHLDALRTRIPDLRPFDVVGRSIDMFQEDPERVRRILKERDRLPYQLNLAVGEIDFVLTFSVVRDQALNPIGYVVEWKDVTEERMREAMLEAINTRQVMAEFDMDGALTTANPAFCELMGESFEVLKGRALDDLLAPT